MTTAATSKTRNQTFECFKLLASVFVVFIHVKFPGTMGEAMTCLARFAVPLFFTVSGYYSFQTGPDRLARRMVRLLTLNALGIVLYFVWYGFAMVYLGTGLPEMLWPRTYHVVRWLLMGVDPYWGHLWFLPSLALGYGILWGYTRFWGDARVDYRPVYTVSALLLLLMPACFEFFPAAQVSVPKFAFRNGLFFALPFLCLGIFLREYRDRILRAFCLTGKKLVWIILGAMAFSLLEWHGIGGCEIYLGTMIAVPAMVLLGSLRPTLTRSPLASGILSRLGAVSTGVYLLHLIVAEAYTPFVRWRVAGIAGDLEPWINPVVVAFLSILAGAFCIGCRDLVIRLRKKKSS